MGFKIMYENVLGNFGLLLCKERIFDNKYHCQQPLRVRRSKKKKLGERALVSCIDAHRKNVI